MFQIRKEYSRADPFRAIKHLLFAFQTLIFPFQCLKCNTWLDVSEKGLSAFSACFCTACLGFGPLLFAPPFCPICGRVFESSDPRSLDTHPCGTCLTAPPPVRQVRAAFQYQGIIKEAIPLFKYQSKLSLARVLEAYLFDAFDRFFADSPLDRILPIPLHSKKMKLRGFNQSFLLVRNFEKKYVSLHGKRPGWQIDTKTLIRVKPTSSQTGFDLQQRKENLKGAFCVGKKADIQGLHILLVDDVYTTGATCSEAARVLLKSGANRVDVLVLARA